MRLTSFQLTGSITLMLASSELSTNTGWVCAGVGTGVGADMGSFAVAFPAVCISACVGVCACAPRPQSRGNIIRTDKRSRPSKWVKRFTKMHFGVEPSSVSAQWVAAGQARAGWHTMKA